MLITAGCAGPALEPGFQSIDPQERTAALLDAARNNDKTAIPQLIVMLGSSDPAERMLASEALRRLTGMNFGYHHSDPAWRRGVSIDTWRRWWEQQTQEDTDSGSTLMTPAPESRPSISQPMRPVPERSRTHTPA